MVRALLEAGADVKAESNVRLPAPRTFQEWGLCLRASIKTNASYLRSLVVCSTARPLLTAPRPMATRRL